MPRGGYRKKAGRKSKWKHGKTTSIRVPKVLASQILDWAVRIDRGLDIEIVADSKVIDVTGLQIISVNGKKAIALIELLKAGYEIKPLGLANTLRKEYLYEINESK